MKFAITGLCAALLLLHMRPTGRLAGAAVGTVPRWSKALPAAGVAGLFIGHLFARHAMSAG